MIHTNVNLEAAVGVLSFLGFCFCIVVGIFVLIFLVAARRSFSAALVLGGLGLGVALYFGILLAFSTVSHDVILAGGDEKHFCEIDCHLAYSVADVKTSQTIGDPPVHAGAGKLFYVVTLKTRFDETTISPARGNGFLYPNGRLLTIRDDHAQIYLPSADGQKALERTAEGGTPITTPLRPGESYMTKVVFELPQDVHNPILLINEREWVTHFIIGHENSFRHGKTWFQIGPDIDRHLSGRSGLTRFYLGTHPPARFGWCHFGTLGQAAVSARIASYRLRRPRRISDRMQKRDLSNQAFLTRFLSIHELDQPS